MTSPSAGGLGDILGGLLGEGSVARQFLVWGVLTAIANEALGPALTALRNDVNARTPETPISPATLADAVLRGDVGKQWAAGEAAKSGVSAGDFDVLISNTGEPPATMEMLSLWRRGEIDTPTLERAIKQSRVKDEWISVVEKMGILPPTSAEVIDALVKGQITTAEAEKRFTEAGGDPTWFTSAYNASGSSPSPLQAAEMALRGIIPWDGTGPGVVSYQQAFLEGHWRNKWSAAFRQLSAYIPPPRTVVTLLHDGVITDAQAVTYFEQAGMTPELAKAYLASAHISKTAAQKQLAVGEVLTLYRDGIISASEATADLVKLGYAAAQITELLAAQVVSSDRKTQTLAVTRVHTLYVAHKISKQAAAQALATLKVAADQVTQMMAVWDLERATNVKTLSEGQIASAVYYKVISEQEGMAELERLGYQPHDAWILLSNRAHAALANEPPPDAVT